MFGRSRALRGKQQHVVQAFRWFCKSPPALKTFAKPARKRMRTASGGYRRDQLHALAQRVEVDATEVRIMRSKSELLRTLVAVSSARTAGVGVPSSVPKWRASKNKTANTYIIEITL